MVLIECSECEGKVSDKASACPHCGLPLTKSILEAIREKVAGVGDFAGQQLMFSALKKNLTKTCESVFICQYKDSEISKSAARFVLNSAKPSGLDIINWLRSLEKAPFIRADMYPNDKYSFVFSRIITGYLAHEHLYKFEDFWEYHLKNSDSFERISKESAKNIYHELLFAVSAGARNLISEHGLPNDWRNLVKPLGHRAPQYANETFIEMVFASLLFDGSGESWDLRQEYWKHVEQVNPDLLKKLDSFPF